MHIGGPDDKTKHRSCIEARKNKKQVTDWVASSSTTKTDSKVSKAEVFFAGNYMFLEVSG